jgi:uncharacterized membrane protein YgaE (UPF0421/DUF939 family)
MVPKLSQLHPRIALARAGQRLRPRLLQILQTAAAAVVAWYVARLTLPDPTPSFAAIAAIIALGASYGERGKHALQLVAGVVLGLLIADVIVHALGAGPYQIGILIVLAMSAAVILGGGETVISEAPVSALLLMALAPGSDPATFSPNRILEGVIGGAVALLVSWLFFPPDPSLQVGRAAQNLFAHLGQTLQAVAAALVGVDVAAAERALVDARRSDRLVTELDEAVRNGQETARTVATRRAMRKPLERYSRSLDQIDFAVRNTRVLARHVLRRVRAGDEEPALLAGAVSELAQSVWELAAAYERPERAQAAREHARAAAELAGEPPECPELAELVAQVRSTAADLRRAADLATDVPQPAAHDLPTEELLAF